MHDVYGCLCHGALVGVREQLDGVGSLHQSLWGFWDGSQVIRLLQQMPLPCEAT